MQDLGDAVVGEHRERVDRRARGEEGVRRWRGRVGGVEGGPGLRDEDLCPFPDVYWKWREGRMSMWGRMGSRIEARTSSAVEYVLVAEGGEGLRHHLDELQRGATIVVPLAEGLEEAVERASKVLANVKTHEERRGEFD